MKTLNNDEKDIAAILSSYESALNRSSTEDVMKLYATDGVFMPQHFPSSVGTDAVRQAYNGVFNTITLSIKFDVIEVQQIAPQWAFARTNSAGKVKINATGQSGAEANQELFLFQKINNQWKISRYSFSTTNPPRN
jgi:uncharacterized protein (TIGR02246 family)